MAGRKIEVQLVGDSSSLQRAFRSSSDAGGKWGRRLGTAAKAGGLAVAAGIGLGVVALKSSVDAAKEAEVSSLRMQAQLKASGLSYEKYAKTIDSVIESQSKLSAFDDEDLQDSFTNLVRVTGDVNEALRLNALAADFARAKSIPVAKAGELIGKVAGGNLGILSRYGITLKDGATATEALGVLQKKFGGQAEAYGKSTAGAQERFGVAVENLQEKIGQKLLPLLTKLAMWGIQFIGWAEENWPRFQEAVSNAVEAVRPFFERLVAYWNTTLLPTIRQVIAFAAALWARFGDDIKRNLKTAVSVIRNILMIIKGVVELVMALIRGDWSAAWAALKSIARNTLQGIVTLLKNMVSNFLSAAKKLGGAIKDGIVAGVRGLAGLLASALRGAINVVIGMIRGFGIPGFKIDPPGPGSFSFPGVHPFSGLPSIDTGGTITRSGLAVVHRGETVTPARVANRGMAGGSGRFLVLTDAQGVAFLQSLNQRHARGNGGRSIW